MRVTKAIPPFYLLTAILLMIGLHFLLPGGRIVPFPYNLIGLAPMAVGLVVNVASSNAFDRAGTTIKPEDRPSHLVTDGCFRFSRHPMYVGMVVLLAGLGLLLGSATPFLVLLPFVWIMRRFMAMEERSMEEVFGEEYQGYAERVRRWL